MGEDKKRKIEDTGESSDEEEIVNVDFDFFSPKEIDFQAVKNLLRQLFGADSQSFDLSSIAGIIISQRDLGSTVKTDGEESDPYALLTVINLLEHMSDQAKPSIKALVNYFIQKTSQKPEFNRALRRLFAPSSKSSVGLIISERLINMPTEVVPPMYKMLKDEIKTAIDNKQPFEFGHYLIASKSFTEEESALDKEDEEPNKKKKKPTLSKKKEVFYFHPEDQVFHEKALFRTSYDYTLQNQDSDSRRTFQDYGISPKGHLILVRAEDLPDLIENMQRKFPPF